MEPTLDCHGPNGPNIESGLDLALDNWSLSQSSRSKNKQHLTINVLEPVEEVREYSLASRPEDFRDIRLLDIHYQPTPLDLQACRDFLVDELAEEEKLPYRLAYADGIQEVRSRLISRYGDERIGSAMNVVYELIENKYNASGLGDDGDKWAPWRFDHQHRHDDFSNLGTPRFPGLILPASERSLLSKRSRTSIKSEDEQGQIPHLGRLPDLVESGVSSPASCSVMRFVGSDNTDDLYFEPVPAFSWRNRLEDPMWTASTMGGQGEGRGTALTDEPSTSERFEGKVAHLERKIREPGRYLTSSFSRGLERIRKKRRGSTANRQSSAISTYREEHPSKEISRRRQAIFGKLYWKKHEDHEKVSDSPPILPAVRMPPALQLDGCTDEVDHNENVQTNDQGAKYGLLNRNFTRFRSIAGPEDSDCNRHQLDIDNNNNANSARFIIKFAELQLNFLLPNSFFSSTLAWLKNISICDSLVVCSRLIDFAVGRLARNLTGCIHVRWQAPSEFEKESVPKPGTRIMSSDDIFLEPTKYIPSGHPDPFKIGEDAFNKYQSIAAKNPFTATASFRENLAARECYFPSTPSSSGKAAAGPVSSHEIWVVPSTLGSSGLHPALRDGDNDESSDHISTARQYVPSRQDTPIPRSRLHKRSASQPQSPRDGSSHFAFRPQDLPKPVKSFSDTNFIRPGAAAILRDRSPNKGLRKPLTVATGSTSGSQGLSTIDEQEAYARNYKMEVRDSLDGSTKVVRSPLKKLFGERGILGRSSSQKETPDPRYKKPGLIGWSSKVKQRVEELTDKIPGFDITKRFSYPLGPSTFPVTLSPYVQGDFYMQLELLLNIETNRFIMSQFQYGRVSVESVRKIVEAWKSKGRPQVIGFRYDLATQRELIALNLDTMHFPGVHTLSKIRLNSVMAVWKSLAKEISIRTFCQPDSAIKKHLHDAEKILELIDAEPDSMLAFQEMRSRIISDIYKQEKLEREREALHGVERSWSPSKLDPQIDELK